VVVRFKDCWAQHPPFPLTALAQALKGKGWMVPVYRLPANAEQIEVIRIVVRAHVSRALADALLNDLEAAVQQLGEQADDGTPVDVWEWPARHLRAAGKVESLSSAFCQCRFIVRRGECYDRLVKGFETGAREHWNLGGR